MLAVGTLYTAKLPSPLPTGFGSASGAADEDADQLLWPSWHSTVKYHL